ncbi:MAG: hypothetical protein PHX51_02125 [Clostridia bacterium]|nr:hypothetical protein [Clostridia bacterium]
MTEDNAKLIEKKKHDKKVMTWFSVVTGVSAAVFLTVGLVMDVNGSTYADGVLAFFVCCLLFCVMGIIIILFISRAIKYIEHPELKVARDEKRAKSKVGSYFRNENGDKMVSYSHDSLVKSKEYRTNPYTDEIEEDDGLSMEEIDFFESDIYDDK